MHGKFSRGYAVFTLINKGKVMKIYFRFLYNFIRLIFKKIFQSVSLSGSLIHSMSKSTQLFFAKKSSINLGRNIQSDGYCKFVVGKNAKLHIGEGTYFNSGCNVGVLESVSIGDKCVFGPNVCVFDNNHDFDENGVKFSNNTSPISIGDRCWLASNVVVLKGVSIGNNCVIGAGCIIKENIPDGSIVTCNNTLRIKSIIKK